MRLSKQLFPVALFILMLFGCQAVRLPDRGDSNADDMETWEMMPFYGELRFLILDQDTGEPIPDAVLQVSNLRIDEQTTGKSMDSGPDGLIIIHQLQRGITYWGPGPEAPIFTFSVQGYQERTYSVDDLAGTSYNPYSAVDLPTVTYLYETDGKELELPVYEFIISLAPSD